MSRKTLEQQIAETTNKLQRLKAQERSARTHRLCQFAGAFDSVITQALLDDMKLLTDEERTDLTRKVADYIDLKASNRRSN